MVSVSSWVKQQEELYREKSEHLENVLEAVSPFEFYREVFPEGSFQQRGRYVGERGNGIGLILNENGHNSDDGDRPTHLIVTDDLEALTGLQRPPKGKFALMSAVSYFGRRRNSKNARYLYAVTFDLDGVGMPQLRDVIHQSNREIIPQPTFVVNSGTGLHLYYVLKEPVPMYPHNRQYLNELKASLTKMVIWNRFTSTIKEPQIQGVLQGFRVVGGPSKLGQCFPVKAYRFGGKVDIDYLLGWVPDSNGEQQRIIALMEKSRLSLEEAKEKYPDWYERRIVKQQTRPHWTANRALYDWWLKRISREIGVGHRYFGIMTLAIYAAKCGISEEELRRDAFDLLESYDGISETEDNRFTEEDINAALKAFNENYVTFPRDEIAKLSGLQIKENKRNGRKQIEHLEIARAIRDISVRQKGKKDWREGNGRIRNSRILLFDINDWRLLHPEGTKADCVRDMGISKTTVYKWWKKCDELREGNCAEIQRECEEFYKIFEKIKGDSLPFRSPPERKFVEIEN